MDDVAVIDRFTDTFSRYIDSGFGLVGGEVAWLAATLIVIDMTLASLFWAMGGADDVLARLIKKVLYVGAFAFIISNFNALAAIIFRSFAGLGLTASGSGLAEGELLQPGRLAHVGVEAAAPIMAEIGRLSGFPDVFSNIDMIAVLLIAWVVVIVSFFVLAIQVFVAVIEFKLTTLAGFVLVPFALWNKTAFLAEKVLGNVMASGVKILVLAVIVGIGSGLFDEFASAPGAEPDMDQVLAIMLGSLTMLALGIFGPIMAGGLISGAPQLGAGAAVGATAAGAGLVVAGGAGAVAGGRFVARTASRDTQAAANLAGRARAAYANGAAGHSGLRAVGAGLGGVARAGAAAPRARLGGGGGTAAAESGEAPAWAARLGRRGGHAGHGASVALHTLRSGDHGGSGASPTLNDPET